MHTLRELGVTRLSLGVENFSDEVLKENGRAHFRQRSERSWQWIQEAEFPNVNIDLIAGMVRETWENWQDCVQRTIDLSPDSVTIYQLELPFNTVYSKDILGNQVEIPVADWPTKRKLGSLRLRPPAAGRLQRFPAPTQWSRIRIESASVTATICGEDPTCWPPA